MKVRHYLFNTSFLQTKNVKDMYNSNQFQKHSEEFDPNDFERVS